MMYDQRAEASAAVIILAEWLQDNPSDRIITAANAVYETYPREYLPDWVEILVTGDPDDPKTTIAIALDDLQDESHASNQ